MKGRIVLEERGSWATPAPIRRRRQVEVFTNRFGSLYDDEVLFPGGTEGRYLRWQWNHRSGVVVVPVGPDGIALIPNYRYPVGASSLEFPRGGCQPGESVQTAAARELREESGLIASAVMPLGQLHTDTGLIANGAHVCLAFVHQGGQRKPDPEDTESVATPVWASQDGLMEWVGQGLITCSVTIAAFTVAMVELGKRTTEAPVVGHTPSAARRH